MYKILVVDDKPLIRKGIIKKIDWYLDIVLIGEASNGLEAIEMIKKTSPNILITDMKMPQMNGSELLTYINAKCNSLKMIVISGYDDFEYLQKSIRSGCVDYLLKPVNKEALNQAIRKCVQLLKNENYFGIILNNNKEIDRMIERVIYKEGEASHLLNIIGDKEYRFLITVVKDLDSILDFEMIDRLKKVIECDYNFVSLNNINEYTCLYCIEDYSQTEEYYNNYLKKTFENFIINSTNNNKLQLLFGISNVFTQVTQINQYYNRTCFALVNFLLYPEQNVFFMKEDQKDYSVLINNEEIAIAILAGNTNALETIIHQLFEELIENRYMLSIEYLIKLLNQILYNLVKIGLDMNSANKFLGRLNNYNNLLELGSIQMIEKELMVFLNLAINELNLKDFGIEKIVEKIRFFIEENYASDITLDELAKMFSLNPSYLTTIYKEITGYNINEYIIRERLNHAERLLKDTDLKISRVAEAVGYSNNYYFSRVFKKATGLSPSMYRNKNSIK